MMVVESAIKGDKDLAITALALNPLVDSDSIGNKVFKELFEAHKKYLTNFQ